MAVTVRLPNGLALTYNAAKTWRVEQSGNISLLDDDGGDIIATIQASAGAVIEFDEPCTIVGNAGTLGDMAQHVAQNARDVPWGSREWLAELKRALRKFDARTLNWKL